jgi:hypothetical protein
MSFASGLSAYVDPRNRRRTNRQAYTSPHKRGVACRCAAAPTASPRSISVSPAGAPCVANRDCLSGFQRRSRLFNGINIARRTSVQFGFAEFDRGRRANEMRAGVLSGRPATDRDEATIAWYRSPGFRPLLPFKIGFINGQRPAASILFSTTSGHYRKV